jgi:hypothetical protein
VNNEFEECRRKRSWPNLRAGNVPSFSCRGWGKPRKSRSWQSVSRPRFKPAPPEYTSEKLPLVPAGSVFQRNLVLSYLLLYLENGGSSFLRIVGTPYPCMTSRMAGIMIQSWELQIALVYYCSVCFISVCIVCCRRVDVGIPQNIKILYKKYVFIKGKQVYVVAHWRRGSI